MWCVRAGSVREKLGGIRTNAKTSKSVFAFVQTYEVVKGDVCFFFLLTFFNFLLVNPIFLQLAVDSRHIHASF